MITIVEKRAGEKTDGFVEIQIPIHSGNNRIKLVTKEKASLNVDLKIQEGIE